MKLVIDTDLLAVEKDHVVKRLPRCKVKGGRGKGSWRCTNKVDMHGMCAMHYMRKKRGMDMTKPPGYDSAMEKAV